MRPAKQWKQLKTRIETLGTRFRFGPDLIFEHQAVLREWNHMVEIWRSLDIAWEVMARARFANAAANCVSDEHPVLSMEISFDDQLSDEGGTYWRTDVRLITPATLNVEQAEAYRDHFDWIDDEPSERFEFLSEAFSNEDQRFTVTLQAARRLFSSHDAEAFLTEIQSEVSSP